MGGRGVYSLSGLNSLRRTKQEDKKVSDNLRKAIGYLGAPATIEQAMMRANEDVESGKDGFMENCYNVVVAYELQRRGYDVKANEHNPKLNLGETIYPYGFAAGYMTSRWAGAFRGAKFEHVGDKSKNVTVNNLTNKIKSYGNGARGAIQFEVKDRSLGHVLNFENKGGKILLIDAQERAKYNMRDILPLIRTTTVNVVRTDNLRLSDRAKNSVSVR